MNFAPCIVNESKTVFLESGDKNIIQDQNGVFATSIRN